MGSLVYGFLNFRTEDCFPHAVGTASTLTLPLLSDISIPVNLMTGFKSNFEGLRILNSVVVLSC